MTTGIGCVCGWPLDSCNPKFANNGPCGKVKYEAETELERVRFGLMQLAEEHEAKAQFFHDVIGQLPNQDDL